MANPRIGQALIIVLHHLFLTWLQNFRITLRSWGFPQYGNTWQTNDHNLKKDKYWVTSCVWIHITRPKFFPQRLYLHGATWNENRATVIFPEETLRHSITYESLLQLLSCRCKMWCEKTYTSLNHSTHTAFPLFSISLGLSVQEAYLHIV